MSSLFELTHKINYEFKDHNLLEKALTHSSYREINDNYEKLEFLGDRVLGLIISKKIYFTFDQDSEGDLAKKLALLVCKKTLIKIANKINLDKFLRFSKEIGEKPLESIKANSMEALVGAIFLDSGFTSTENLPYSSVNPP